MESANQADMYEELRRVYASDPEAGLLQICGRSLADPVKPKNENGQFRPHPLLILLGTFGGLAVSVFVYFTCFQP
jgi:hypothetical protein